jgi:hypothetical protein
MTHSLSIRVAEMCLRSRSTLPLLAVDRWVLSAKEMLGAVSSPFVSSLSATCVRIGEQH